jgi:dUTP pyrophosphatase
MKVKFKKLSPSAVTPCYSKPGDAGMDLTATSKVDDKLFIEFGTGISVEIPEGYVGLLFARSSISKTVHILANHVGVIDSGYRGEIKLRFKNPVLSFKKPEIFPEYNVGDKIGQLVIIPYPQIELVEVEELSTSERMEGGFGSTGV